MKKFIVLLMTWVTILTTSVTAADLANIPELNSPVMDTVHILNAQEKTTLEQSLYNFYQQHGSQIVVLIVATTDPENIFDYSSRVFEKWKIGRKEYSDGVLVVVSLKNKEIGIWPGSGLEGAIPDSTAKQIISQIIKPDFQQKNYFAGLFNATQIIEKLILGEELPINVLMEENHFLPFLLFFLFLHYLLYFFRNILNTTLVSCLSSVMTFIIAYYLGYSILIVIALTIASFFITFFGLMYVLIEIFKLFLEGSMNANGRGGPGGGFRGGGFSGGGGGFSGGGASGNW